jgi:hypothetical protein
MTNDKISCEFVRRTLFRIKLHMNMINLIMHSVINVETNVTWHGARADYFRPQWRICQDDPFSPYFFVLCVDKLLLLVENIESK